MCKRSPYIYPPSKVAASRSNGSGIENGVKVGLVDVSWGGWMLLIVLLSQKVTYLFCDELSIEFRCQFWCGNFRDRFPRVVFIAIPFPLDEILEFSSVPATVEYLFYLLLHFSVDDYGQ